MSKRDGSRNGTAGMLARGRCQIVFWTDEQGKELISDAANWQGDSIAGFVRRAAIAAAQVVTAQARESGSPGLLSKRKGPRAGKRLRP